MEDIIAKEKEFIDLIHVIRGQQVMLDYDLAELYGYEVRTLNQQVKRHIEKFPTDFMFQLSNKEMDELSLSQFVIAIQKKGRKGGRSSNIYAFTEIGVYMLATILKGDVATQQSIYIMRSFSQMKHYLAENKLLLNTNELLNIHIRLEKQEADINKIMDNFIDDSIIKDITILNGQKFEANEAYISIYKQAKHSIYIVDDYINIDTLSLLKSKQINVDITIFSDNKGSGKQKLHELEIKNFKKQYGNLTIKGNSICHDRYIIIDYDTENEMIYHCGASSKDAGNKVCSINQMNDKESMHLVIEKLLKIKDCML